MATRSSATVGSTRVARRAGIHVAISVAIETATATPTSITGCEACRANSPSAAPGAQALSARRLRSASGGAGSVAVASAGAPLRLQRAAQRAAPGGQRARAGRQRSARATQPGIPAYRRERRRRTARRVCPLRPPAALSSPRRRFAGARGPSPPPLARLFAPPTRPGHRRPGAVRGSGGFASTRGRAPFLAGRRLLR